MRNVVYVGWYMYHSEYKLCHYLLSLRKCYIKSGYNMCDLCYCKITNNRLFSPSAFVQLTVFKLIFQ